MARVFMHKCQMCGEDLPITDFFQINDICFPNGIVPICINCLKKEIKAHDSAFDFVDRILQWMGVPFLVDKWLEVQKNYKDHTIEAYVKMYKENKFPYIDWKSAYLEYKELEEQNQLVETIPQFSTAKLNELRTKWGEEYTEESELRYLEKLYDGIKNEYSLFGENQYDQVRKICKIALIIDQKIRAGEDFDKYIKSYDQLCKMANLTPKNIKNAADFSSVGELFAYLEKTKWMNEFYSGVEKDIVDNTMKNIQKWSRNFYINESSIPEDVEARIQALKLANEMEEDMNRIEDDGMDTYYQEMEDEDFDPSAGM